MEQRVRTVLGDVPAASIGHTQTHEHLLIDLSRPLPSDASPEERERDEAPITLGNYYATRREHTSHDLRLESIDEAVEELLEYREAGGSAVVDATPVGLQRSAPGLRDIAQRTGVHVVMGCGYYYRDYHPAGLDERHVSSIADEIITDITEGVGDEKIQAGVIGEIGLSWPHHPREEAVLQGAVEAQNATGAALLIHPARHIESPFKVMDFVAQHGGDPGRVIMSHIDRTLFDDGTIGKLADKGCYMEFDLFGQESSYYSLSDIDMPNDATRVGRIQRLIENGHGEKILISQDVCHKTNLRRHGGEGYTHIIRHVIPLMRRKGLTNSDIERLTIHNPREALALS